MQTRTHQFGFYLTDFDPFDSNRTQSGIDRKIISQIETLNQAGLNCKSLVAVRPSSAALKGLASLPLFPDFIHWPYNAELASASYLYIRRPVFSTKGFISFLELFRRCNPDALVLLELPTFPYDAEYDRPELYFALRKDRKYRQYWKKYIDRVVELTGLPEVFGIETVHIINGIDLRRCAVRRPSFKSDKPLEIIFPASFAAYQGCDLLIGGLADYYDKGGIRDIIIHLAGDGPEIPVVRKLVERRNLKDHVVFHGMLTLSELNVLYDRCTLGVASLGMHRRGSNVMSGAIKTREYLAKGLPFFYAGLIDVFERNPVDFCLRFESREVPVDIRRVVEFHDRLYECESETSLIKRIRRYAEENVSMEAAMSSVIDIIKEHNSLNQSAELPVQG